MKLCEVIDLELRKLKHNKMSCREIGEIIGIKGISVWRYLNNCSEKVPFRFIYLLEQHDLIRFDHFRADITNLK